MGKRVLLHFKSCTRTIWRHLRALYSHKACSILVHLIHALYYNLLCHHPYSSFRRVDYVEADMAHAHTPYYVVQTLITNLLELDTCRTASEKEHALMQHITDLKLREKMFLLNDLLGTHVSRTVVHDGRCNGQCRL